MAIVAVEKAKCEYNGAMKGINGVCCVVDPERRRERQVVLGCIGAVPAYLDSVDVTDGTQRLG